MVKIARDDVRMDEQTCGVVGQVVERVALAAAGRIVLRVGNGEREVIGYATGSVAVSELKPGSEPVASTMMSLSPAPEYRTKDYKLHVQKVHVLSTAEEGRLDEFVR